MVKGGKASWSRQFFLFDFIYIKCKLLLSSILYLIQFVAYFFISISCLSILQVFMFKIIRYFYCSICFLLEKSCLSLFAFNFKWNEHTIFSNTGINILSQKRSTSPATSYSSIWHKLAPLFHNKYLNQELEIPLFSWRLLSRHCNRNGGDECCAAGAYFPNEQVVAHSSSITNKPQKPLYPEKCVIRLCTTLNKIISQQQQPLPPSPPSLKRGLFAPISHFYFNETTEQAGPIAFVAYH